MVRLMVRLNGGRLNLVEMVLPPQPPPYEGGAFTPSPKGDDFSGSLPFIRGGLGWGTDLRNSSNRSIDNGQKL